MLGIVLVTMRLPGALAVCLQTQELHVCGNGGFQVRWPFVELGIVLFPLQLVGVDSERAHGKVGRVPPVLRVGVFEPANQVFESEKGKSKRGIEVMDPKAGLLVS